MKQNLRFIFMALLCAVCSMAWGEDKTDVLDQTFTGVTGQNYTDWSGKTATSSAVYAGNSAGSYSSIQLRSNNSNSGIISTTSGGKIKSVSVIWNNNTAEGRVLYVYGSNTAYNSPTDLYNNSNQGTLIGSIKKGTSEPTSLTITDDYAYIGLRSASGAMYVTEIDITWEKSGPTAPAVSFASSSVRVGVRATTTNALTKPDDLTVSYSNSDPNVATYNPETGVVEGVAEGEATITASWAAVEDKYNAGSTSFTVTVSNTFRATFDFTGTNAYGSELVPSDKYVSDSKTWESDGVQLVTAGRYRWLESTNGNSLRLHKAYGNATNGSITISPTNSSHVITKIEFDTNVSGISTMTSGTFNNIIWEGICNTITFAHDGTSDTQIIKTITITYGPAPTIPVTISNAGYATMYYGTKHLIVPEGVEAYTCKVESDQSITHTTTFTAGEVMPAGTAVLLHATAGNYIFTESVNAGNKTVGENMLKGYDVDSWTKGPNEETTGFVFYILSLDASNDPSSVGFYYKENNGEGFTSEAHKAFLAVPNDIAEVSSYVFDDQTGIKTVEMSTNKEGIYTLSGVRMQSDNLPAGLYIVNGKKMVIK